MAEQTDNYGLTLPNENDFYNVEDFNGNMQKIDTEIKNTQNKADQAFQSASSGKAAIKAAITGVDSSITIPTNPTFQQLADCIEDIEIDPYADKGTLTGQSVQFPTADNGLVEITNIQGKYNQFATVQGKNFFDKDKAIIANLYNNSGVLNTSGSSAYSVIFKCLPNTIYSVRKTAGVRFQVSSTSVYPAVGVTVNNHVTNNSGSTINNFITGNNDEYLLVYYFLGTTDTITEVDMRASIQIELASTATAYEPFVPNSPSPEYPSVIHNVGDVPFNTGASGKNRYPTLVNSVANGITVTVSEDGTITLNGTATYEYTKGVPYVDFLPAGTYTLSANNTQVNSNVRIKLSTTSSGLIYQNVSLTPNTVNKSQTFTITDGFPAYAHIYIASGTTLNNFIIKPQLELGSTATSYEPYKGNQTPVSDTYGALPDGTHDEFVSDGISAKKIQRKARIVFDGSVDENWSLNSSNTNTLRFYIPGLVGGKAVDYGSLLCSQFKVTGNDTTDTEHCRKSTSAFPNDFYIWINKNRLASLDVTGFRSWLSSNHVTVDYALETPTESPRDRIFLTSYSGITNVYTTDPLQPTFTAVAKSELWSGRKFVIPGAIKNADSKVAIPTNATFAQLAAAIGQIQTGIDTKDATAIASQILAGMTAYVNDIKLTGTMQNRGAVSQSLPINSSYIIPQGYHNGSGSVSQSIPTKAAATYNPSTSAQTIAAGQYLSGAQTIAPTTGTANSGQVLSGYTFNSGYGIGLTGNIPIVNPDYADQTVASNVSVGASSGDGLNYAYLNHGLSGKYSNGANWVRRYEPYLRPENILSGASIMGINGTAIAGKRFASGTVTSTPTNSGYYVGPGGVGTNLSNITVSGLTFLPSLIVIIRLGLNITDNVIYSTDGIGLSTNPAIKIVLHRYSYAAYQNQSNLVGMFGVSDSAYITSTGFNLPVITASASHVYYAIE